MDTTYQSIRPNIENNESEKKNKFNLIFQIFKNGIIAGGMMVVFLTLIQLSQNDNSISLKFLKYIFLAVVLAFTLKQAKDYFPPLTFFKRGIQIGAGISLISGLMIMLSNFILFLTDTSLTFSKFGLEANSFGRLLVLDITLLFEIFAIGMIITFACLQRLKY